MKDSHPSKMRGCKCHCCGTDIIIREHLCKICRKAITRDNTANYRERIKNMILCACGKKMFADTLRHKNGDWHSHEKWCYDTGRKSSDFTNFCLIEEDGDIIPVRMTKNGIMIEVTDFTRYRSDSEYSDSKCGDSDDSDMSLSSFIDEYFKEINE